LAQTVQQQDRDSLAVGTDEHVVWRVLLPNRHDRDDAEAAAVDSEELIAGVPVGRRGRESPR
jgi:predicted NACHT family NTPase